MRKKLILSILLSVTLLSLFACGSSEIADKITIHTQNASIQNFKSKKAILSKSEDISTIQSELEKIKLKENNSQKTELVGATEYAIKLYKEDKIEAIYNLYGDTLTYYSDPSKDKNETYKMTSKQQESLQQKLDKFLK